MTSPGNQPHSGLFMGDLATRPTSKDSKRLPLVSLT